MLENLVYSDPEFKTLNNQDMSRDQKYAESIRKHVLVWKKMKELNLTDDFDKHVLLKYVRVRWIYISEYSNCNFATIKANWKLCHIHITV